MSKESPVSEESQKIIRLNEIINLILKMNEVESGKERMAILKGSTVFYELTVEQQKKIIELLHQFFASDKGFAPVSVFNELESILQIEEDEDSDVAIIEHYSEIYIQMLLNVRLGEISDLNLILVDCLKGEEEGEKQTYPFFKALQEIKQILNESVTTTEDLLNEKNQVLLLDKIKQAFTLFGFPLNLEDYYTNFERDFERLLEIKKTQMGVREEIQVILPEKPLVHENSGNEFIHPEIQKLLKKKYDN